MTLYERRNFMKKYTSPSIDVIRISSEDIISTSIGTETSAQDENDGEWNVNSNSNSK